MKQASSKRGISGVSLAEGLVKVPSPRQNVCPFQKIQIWRIDKTQLATPSVDQYILWFLWAW
jgi:hypothetical protein